MTAGGFAIPERGRGARPPEEAERPVGPAGEGPLELRRRFARPPQLEEDLSEELGRRLDGSRWPEGRRKIAIEGHGFLHSQDRVALPTGGDRQERGQLFFHHRHVALTVAGLLGPRPPRKLGERHLRELGVAAPGGTHADGEELAAGVEVPCGRELLERAGLDDVAGAHVRQDRLEAWGIGGLHRRLHEIERLPCFLEAALLERLVAEPGEAVIVAHADREPLALDPGFGRAKRSFIGGGRVVPHAELEKDVGGHVQRVAGLRRDLRVGARRGEGPPGVVRVVVVVDQVVESSRMIGMALQHLLQDRRRFLLDRAAYERMLMPVVAAFAEERRAARRGAHQREGQQALHVGILGMRRRQAPHRLRVRVVALRAVPASEQHLDGPKKALLAVGPCLRRARLRRRRQPSQGLARLGDVLIEPERLVVGHGFPPVGHGEIAIDALGLAEGLDGVFVLEVMKGGHAAQEGGLRRSRSGIGKRRQDDERDERERAHRRMLACASAAPGAASPRACS